MAWVRDASVARVWPNRVMVRVQERTPVAFVRLDASRFGLIDDDGVILPPATDRLASGAGRRQASDPVAKRRERRAAHAAPDRDLGDATANISEIDVSDRDNLKVTAALRRPLGHLAAGRSQFRSALPEFLE